MRSRKPKVHFDDRIAQSLGPSKPSAAPNAPTKPTTKPTAKPTTKPTAKPAAKPAASTKPSAAEPSGLDPIQELCSQIEGLEITENAKKKAKSEEIARLRKLGFHSVLAEVKPLKDVEFEPIVPGDHWEPKLNILFNIDPTDPLALLDLFIPATMYTTIAENTNLYAIVHNAPTSTTLRYWYPTNEHEIQVLFGVLYYMGVHKEPKYRIYWETPKLNGPIHAIPKHMSLNRYQNLRCYLHISPLKRLVSQMETQQPLQACLEA
jgi:Transposase IS4